MKIGVNLACAVFLLSGCGSNFRHIYTSTRFQDGQIAKLEASATAAGYPIRERTQTSVSFKTPATVIIFARDRDGTLGASCFDSQDQGECDAVIMKVAQQAGIVLR